MVIESGDYSGAKNVTGGRLYVSPHPSPLPGALGVGALRASGHPRAGHADGRRRPHDNRVRLRQVRHARLSVVHRAPRHLRPVARRPGHGEGRHGHHQEPGRRPAHGGRQGYRHPRRRGRDRRRHDHHRRRHAGPGLHAAGLREQPIPKITPSASRRSWNCRPMSSQAAGTCRQARAPPTCSWAPSPTACWAAVSSTPTRTPSPWASCVGMEHCARTQGEDRDLEAPRRVQGDAPDRASGRRRHHGGVLGPRHLTRPASPECPSSTATATCMTGDAAGLALNAL